MAIYLVVLVATLNQIGYGGSRIAVSLYALELGANQLTIGVMIALYSLCPMFLAIIVGRYADRMPPRLPIIIGSIFTVIALVLPPLFPGIATLYVSAFMLGLFHLVFTIPVEAVVGGIGGGDKRARNYIMISLGWSTASFFGPLITGFSIDNIGHLPAFLLLAAFVLAPIIILFFVPDLFQQTETRTDAGPRGSVLDLWRIQNLRTTFITVGIIGTAQDLFQFYMPIYGHSIGLSASAIGAVLGMVAAAAFTMRAVLPFILKRYTEPRILVVAVFLAAIAYLLLPHFVNPFALAAIAFLLGLGVGSAQPLSMSLLYVLTPVGRIAESIGLHKTVRNTSQLLIPIFFGSVGAAFGFNAVFLSNALVLATGGVLLSRARVPDSALRSRSPDTGHND